MAQLKNMTKRCGNFELQSNKRTKAQDDLNDLWGDDPDINDIDDCIMLATQVCDQSSFSCTQRNNVSLLPSYNAFKQSAENALTSTQAHKENLPRTTRGSSKVPLGNTAYPSENAQANYESITNNGRIKTGFKRAESFDSTDASTSLQIKTKKLQKLVEIKDGEISILRTQLKQTKANIEVENDKKQQEWLEKAKSQVKKLTAVQSELEFKNLEIVNLKQKVLEVSKFVALHSANESSPVKGKLERTKSSSTKSVQNVSGQETNVRNLNITIRSVLETECPLNGAVSLTILNAPRQEMYIINTKYSRSCRHTIPLLQNQMSEAISEKCVNLQLKRTCVENKRELDIDYVFPEIFTLMGSTRYEINSDERIACINKITCVSQQLLQNLHEFLQELERYMQTEDIRQIDMLYLENKLQESSINSSIFDTKEWTKNEIGINIRQIVAFLSELLPHSAFLQGYIVGNRTLAFTETEKYLEYFPCVRCDSHANRFSNNFNYLNLLLDIINIIGKTRNANKFPGFLCSVISLLNKICTTTSIEPVFELIFNVTKEIVYSRPSLPVLCYLSEFLKNVSLQNIFVESICTRSSAGSLKINSTEEILYFNRGTCLLQVICVLLERNVVKFSNLQNYLQLFMNFMKFVSNCVSSNAEWLFYQERSCDCLCKLNKLTTELFHETLNKWHKNLRNQRQSTLSLKLEFCNVFEDALKILCALNFKSDGLIVKSIGNYSQSKSVVKTFLDLKDALNLPGPVVSVLLELNTPEDFPALHAERFDAIPLW